MAEPMFTSKEACLASLKHLSEQERENKEIEAECPISREDFVPLATEEVSATDNAAVKPTNADDEADVYQPEPEVPVCIPCGHVFGQTCLTDWLNVSDDQETCSNC